MRSLRPLILAGAAAAALGEITNPTGSCVSDYDDGHRTHVPDCNNPLKREYWRVFLRDDSDGNAPMAYMLPRPDGMGTKYGLCDEELFQMYALCDEMSTTEAVEKINNIPLEDALTIAHTLHSNLVFEAYGDMEGASPYPYEIDVYAVCDAGLATENVLGYCQSLRDLCDEDGNCSAVAIIPSKETVEDLVPALNELYGIELESAPESEITNPTGSCVSDYDDGHRTHVPDCNNPLKREYWRVFLRDDSDGDVPMAYLLPRPDGRGAKFGLCDEELFQTYTLCDELDVEKINNIPLEDALTIANKLHSNLVFKAWGDMEGGEGMRGVSPYPYEIDVYALCDAGMATENVLGYCQSLRDRCNEDGECIDIGIIPSKETVEDLVPALNELYGIETESAPGDPNGEGDTKSRGGKLASMNVISSGAVLIGFIIQTVNGY